MNNSITTKHLFTSVLLITLQFYSQCNSADNTVYVTIDNLNCKEDLFDYPDKHNYGFVNHFANCWNDINDQFNMLDEDCLLPDGRGLISVDREWVKCDRRRMKDHNRLLKEIKSLESIKARLNHDFKAFDIFTEIPSFRDNGE